VNDPGIKGTDRGGKITPDITTLILPADLDEDGIQK
jgi:hypothetical protein